MSVCKLGFFSKKKVIKKQNLNENLNLLASNLKNNLLRRLFYAYIQQELQLITNCKLSKKVKKKRKKLLIKCNLRQHWAKPLSLQINNKKGPVEEPEKKSLSESLNAICL